jgi:hypothetical protein
LQSIDESKRNDAFNLIEILDEKIPRENEEDYTYLMRFGQACILRAPFVYIKSSINKYPEVFEKAHKLKKDDITPTLSSDIYCTLYKYLVYKPYREGYIGILIILFSIYFVATMYKHNTAVGLTIITILLCIWMLVVVMILISPGSYRRLRLPVEPFVTLIILYGIYDLVLRIKTLVTTRKKPVTDDG